MLQIGKRILCAVLSLLMALPLAACSTGDGEDSDAPLLYLTFDEDSGSEHLTAIVGQYDKDKKQGFILGYQRYGKLFFQAGTGEAWLSVNSEDRRLEKDAWNQVTAVFDGKGGRIALYLNGKAVGERPLDADAAIAPAEKEALLVEKNTPASSSTPTSGGRERSRLRELA